MKKYDAKCITINDDLTLDEKPPGNTLVIGRRPNGQIKIVAENETPLVIYPDIVETKYYRHEIDVGDGIIRDIWINYDSSGGRIIAELVNYRTRELEYKIDNLRAEITRVRLEADKPDGWPR